MRLVLFRLMPAFAAVLLLVASGSAQAHGLDELIQCVFAGPFDNCG